LKARGNKATPVATSALVERRSNPAAVLQISEPLFWWGLIEVAHSEFAPPQRIGSFAP